jgi:hypothetical protein
MSTRLMAVTPGLRDILHHLQFCTILGMIAVQWPTFVCTSYRSYKDDAHG